mmetsp:Transcript_30671/g.97870  ORF Transcript_30671/g.97870 Transcript_30671/m.97870 type:complete len:230 (-) Transcript_30671:316-1005(-)
MSAYEKADVSGGLGLRPCPLPIRAGGGHQSPYGVRILPSPALASTPTSSTRAAIALAASRYVSVSPYTSHTACATEGSAADQETSAGLPPYRTNGTTSGSAPARCSGRTTCRTHQEKKGAISKLSAIDSLLRLASPIHPSRSSRWSQSVGIVCRFDCWAETARCCMRLSVVELKCACVRRATPEWKCNAVSIAAAGRTPEFVTLISTNRKPWYVSDGCHVSPPARPLHV